MRFRALFLLIALLLAACGGSATPDADDPGDTDDQATTTTATVDDPDDDDTDDDQTTGLLTGECLAIGVALSQAASMGVLGQGGDPTDAADSLAAMSGAAPAEIADDFEILAEAYSAFAAALEGAGVDFSDAGSLSSPEAQAALATAGEAFASSGVEEASNNISEYMDEVCDN
ncbi:MAG TPA: hypothetical protein VM848_02420 [Acidimicrobiia bacterium]|nr:hypothetical protein [Acidimicrobiia bacterium]